MFLILAFFLALCLQSSAHPAAFQYLRQDVGAVDGDLYSSFEVLLIAGFSVLEVCPWSGNRIIAQRRQQCSLVCYAECIHGRGAC